MHIYFSGIGGAGLSALAILAKQSGYQVSGSDKEESLGTEAVKKAGIEFSLEQSEKHLEQTHSDKPVDLFVYTAALPKDHPELAKAKELGLKSTKRDGLINQIAKDKKLKLIAVTGTHGKTTTTSMMAWAVVKLDLQAAYLLGTNIGWGPSAKYSNGDRYLIFETDEYDRNMLKFEPELSVITSLDFDHPDTYKDQEEYDQAFRDFATQSSRVIAWREDAKKAKLENINTLDESVDLSAIKLAGNHNKRNAYLAIEALQHLQELSLNADELLITTNDYSGSERRFEKLADNIYTDYAHHPVEIAATIQLAKELSNKVVVVYQPHQNVRQHAIKEDYDHCFDRADYVYWLPTYLTREDESLEVLSPAHLMAEMYDPDMAETAEMNDNLAKKIKDHAKNGDLVVLMGAGDIDAWAREKFNK